MLFVALAVVVVVALLFVVSAGSRTASLNGDPAQRELADAMAEAAADGSVAAWHRVVAFLEAKFPSLSAGQRETRLAHALSMLKGAIPDHQYDHLRVLSRVYRAHHG